jgi:uncharacterized protein (DUF1499 family)
MWEWVLIAIIVVVAGLAAWVRVAPSDPMRWHLPIEAEADKDFNGGVIRVVEAGPDALAQLDEIARATPRTEVLAGSVADGRVTYITRTKWIGFPDYTTAEQDGDVLKLYARLRFGQSDMGVNRARVERWLAELRN